MVKPDDQSDYIVTDPAVWFRILTAILIAFRHFFSLRLLPIHLEALRKKIYVSFSWYKKYLI